ncbi:MAG: hypothetical protein U0163_17015 [Gemmatimonadaceae bacterium]
MAFVVGEATTFSFDENTRNRRETYHRLWAARLGKTTRAQRLEASLGAPGLAPDERMEALALDLYDERMRARVEELHGNLICALLARGLTVVIEAAAHGRALSETRCALAPERSARR